MTPLQVLIDSIRGRLSMQESSQPDGSSATELRHDHQYFSSGVISTAPPRRAAGIRDANAIASSMPSAS